MKHYSTRALAGLSATLLLSAGLVSTALADVPRRGESTAAPTVPEPADGRVRGDDEHKKPPAEMSAEAKPAIVARELFGPDPNYLDKPYDVKAQLAIYGGKFRVDGPRPPIEWGYPMYQAGPIGDGITIFGDKNPARPELLVFGDLRLGMAYNDNGAVNTAQMAARLNLNVDMRLTATERIHAFFRPLDRVERNRTTRVEFGGNQSRLLGKDNEIILDATPEALFFEGDLGQIANGITGRYQSYDIPVSFGLMPLLFQNGVWMEDAIMGGAFTLPARNSPMLDISNMDFTFFGGFDRVTTRAIPGGRNPLFDDHRADIVGTAIFVERREMYFEFGYGYTADSRGDRLHGDFSYHNFTAAMTKRWFGLFSNSVRVIGNVGQNPGPGFRKTADGWLVLLENSLITSRPYTLLPYANFFYGSGRPQSLARDFGAGGILKNTGINFETDGLTGFPKLDDTANDTYGGAVGVQYLFALDQQLVFEFAGLNPIGPDKQPNRVAKAAEYALGVRYQRPLSKQWIFRTDAIYGVREQDKDVSGVRFELRMKF